MCVRVAFHLPQERVMKKLEMKDLTEAEKAEIALLVQKAQANADHPLTNGERNKIREAGRLKIASDRAKAAKAASALARGEGQGSGPGIRCCPTPSSTGLSPSATNSVADADASMNACG